MPKKLSLKLNKPKSGESVSWNPWLGVVMVLGVYLVSQIVGLVILIYPALNHWTSADANNWLNNSIYAQFFYILIVEGFTVLAVLQILKWFKVDKKVIGLRRPKLKDPLYALLAIPVYYLLYIVAVVAVSFFVKGLNVSETQNVGFTHVHGAAELIVTFISLVALPPIAEEILVRGMLYSSLKKGLPQIVAAILTSVIFATAHLPEGTKGLLWIGFIDTFILSMVLVFLREKTNGLWSGMLVHGVKNGVAYYVLYLAPLITLHI